MKTATSKDTRRWLIDVASFTVAGLMASALVGATLGYLGAALGLEAAGSVGAALLLAVIVTAGSRELGWTAIPLLQARRQTAGIWAKRLGLRKAAILWGVDLGLFITTRQNYAGAWLVPVLALLAASPGFGAGLFAAYWLGRAVSVWVAPLWMPAGTDTPQLMRALAQSRRAAQLIHVSALAWAAVVVVGMVGRGGHA